MTIQRPPFPPVQLGALQAAVFRQIDGMRTIRQCLSATRAGGEVHDSARLFFRSLWRMGYILLRMP